MKRPVDLVASARRAASLFGLFAAMASPALAGDRALVDFIGFSVGAEHFAFEEYGIWDGTGFAYSNIYVIDMAKDVWLEGTPIWTLAEDDNLPAIRAKAMAEAQAVLDEHGINIPADIAALSGDGAPNADGRQLDFGIPGFEPGTLSQERQLTISTFPASASEDCVGFFGTAPLGYELRLTGGAEAVVLHRDGANLPMTRGCPLDYRLYAVVLPWYGGEQGKGVAIISLYAGGFEGPQRRFLAVPFAF